MNTSETLAVERSQASATAAPAASGQRTALRAVYIVLALATLIAIGVRVAPLVQGGNRLRYQCVTEDGYLMLTIARNLAIGNGLSISGGEIATNGTQPLMTLVYAACFKLVGGDRLRGLYPVVAVQVLLSIATALALYLATKRFFYRGSNARQVALLAAGLWFISPSSVIHSQNGLETGLCALLIVLVAATYDAFSPRLAERLSVGACLLLGALLGASFLGRNDACLLAAVLLVVHLARGWRAGYARRALAQAFIIGAVSVVVALPWLAFNVARFGHIVPVSGRAEALHVAWGSNLGAAFVALLENVTLCLRVPGALQSQTVTMIASAAVLIGLLVFAMLRRSWLARSFSPGVGVMAGFLAALFVYYAIFFGMPSFLGRYFFVAVTLAAILVSAVIVTSLPRTAFRRAAVPICLVAVLLAAGLDLRIYRRGTQHTHAQIVDWVLANVDDQTWVGAVQTGTLGYYHDRSINLDGKVDPHAFEYRRQNRICDYVIERNVQYIVDWAGIAEWVQRPEFAANYRLLFADQERNLAVLVRLPGEHAEAKLNARAATSCARCAQREPALERPARGRTSGSVRCRCASCAATLGSVSPAA